MHLGAGLEALALEFDVELGAERLGIGKAGPESRAGGLEQDVSFDVIDG